MCSDTKVEGFYNMLVVAEVLVVQKVMRQDTGATAWRITFKRTVEVSSNQKSVALRQPSHALL